MAILGDVATYVNGYAFKPSDWSGTGLPIIRIQDLTGNSYQTNRYNGEYDKRYEVNNGDILISWSASLGVYILTGEKAVLNQHIFKVVFYKAEVNKSFFVHQVQNILEKAASQAHGATMKHLTKPVFDALPFKLPSLAEQQHIASVLDKLTGLISLRKQQLAKLDELVKARFVEMFGDPETNPLNWKQATLRDVAIGKLAYGSGASSCAYDGNVRYVRITDIDDNGKLNSDIVSPSIIEEKYILNEGDILFARSGATVGKTFRYHKADGKCLYAGYLIRLIPDQRQVLPDYIFYYTKTDYYENFIASNMKVVAQPNINAQQYGNLIICVPPISEQQDFVSSVQKINRQKLTIQQSLDKLEVLRKSLMQEYFG